MATTPARQSPQPSQWPADPIPPVGYLSRKALPIKKNDAEPLTRVDVQYDLLDHIFSDSNAVFTNQTAQQPSAKITFCDLYVNAIFNSSKCSKVLKEKMVETPAFAIELAKISLLTNVGRINTTMAFFPEMKTALRTYHPVPSLQKTDGNAQDAPRIKNCLKAATLPSEFKLGAPQTPEQMEQKRKDGQIPPTSVVNLIFILATHAGPLATVHFDAPLNFLDLFLPVNISSADRARAFLWLMFCYLEQANAQNPFDDEYSRKYRHLAKVPWLRRLTEDEQKLENIDTPEEIEWGRKMSSQRNAFLQKLVSSVEKEKKARIANPSSYRDADNRRSRIHRPQIKARDLDENFLHYVPPEPEPQQIRNPLSFEASEQTGRTHPSQYEPRRTMLQQAWHIVTTTDPLIDSDEENPTQHVHRDYSQRLRILNRLRGSNRSPSPETPHSDSKPQQTAPVSVEMRNSFPGRWQEVSWD